MRIMRGRLSATLAAGALVLAVAPVWLATPSPARAREITVTTTEDVIADDGQCSLREAIIAANTNTTVDACRAGDTIKLVPGNYRLAIEGTDEDAAATGDLDILVSVNIEGDHAIRDPSATVIDGVGLDRVFDIHGRAYVVMRDLTVTGGMTDGEGGGIRLADNAVGPEGCTTKTNAFLVAVTIRGNHATTGGGVSVGTCTWFEGDWYGVAVIDNEATADGGGIAVHEGADFGFTNGVISGNVAGAHGGGIWAQHGSVWRSVLYSDIVDNRAETGGGVYIESRGRGGAPIWYSILFANKGGNSWVEGDEGGYVPDPLLLPRDENPVGYRLRPGSWAIDAGSTQDVTLCGPIGDAYGNARPLDGDGDGVAQCDFGMYEFPAAPSVSTSPSIPNTAVPDAPPDRHAIVWLVSIGLLGLAVLRVLWAPGTTPAFGEDQAEKGSARPGRKAET